MNQGNSVIGPDDGLSPSSPYYVHRPHSDECERCEERELIGQLEEDEEGLWCCSRCINQLHAQQNEHSS